LQESNYISAVIITHNEERNIARCLNSLKGLADEIIVVDSFSSDQTKEICRSFSVNFISHEWEGYSGSKNFGNNQARYSWILSLDADEAISPELSNSLLEQKSKGFNAAYKFNRLTNYCGHWVRYGGWYPDKKIRLFHKDQASWKGNFVHEELVVNEGIPVEELKGDILHYSYYTIEEHLERSEKYARLGAEKIASKKTTSFLKPYLSAATRFIQMYLLKAGFLDGYYGWKIATITSREVFLKYNGARKIRI
jgi:(heptosyl)LPS beta-1,4-glucosyltransferase